MKTYQALLEHLNRRIELNEEEIEEFSSILTTTTIPKKKYLVQPEATVNHIYYVTKGCLKGYYQDEAGNKHILQFAMEDWWITDFNAFQNKVPTEMYIEAIEDSILIGIHINALNELYVRIPKFEKFFRLLYSNAFIALRKRVMSSLKENSADRYVAFCNNYPNLEKRVTNYHIANYLGITAESLSRIRREIDSNLT